MEDPVAALYDAHAAWLWRTARSLLGTAADAEDAVQEVFLALVRGGVETHELRQPKAYLATALIHAAGRLGRRRSRRAWEVLSDHPAPALDHDHQDHRLDQALASLNPDQRQVVALKIEADLTFAEIGAALDISPNTAASRWRLALDHLRRHLPSEDA